MSQAVVAFVKPVGIGFVIAVAFVLIYLAALHDPRPQALAVGVVAPDEVVHQIDRSVTTDAVAFRSFGDAASARRAVETGDVVASYQPGPSPTLLVAGAHGPATVQTVVGVFQGVATAQGDQLRVADVVPLTKEDPRGFSIFYLIFGITLGAFIYGQTSHLYSKGLSLAGKLAQALTFAVAAGVAGAVVAGPMFHVVPGPGVAVAAILALLAGAAGVLTMLFTRYLGDPGIALSTLLVVILGNATSGGAVPAAFLPDGFRQISPLLPPGAATNALRDIAYFDPANILPAVLVLSGWTVGALLLLLLGNRKAPDQAFEARLPREVQPTG